MRNPSPATRARLRAGLFSLMLCWGACQPFSREDSANTAKVQSMFGAFNRHDWKTMAAFYADSARFLDPSFGKTYVPQTRQQTEAKYAGLAGVFAGLHDEVTGLYPAGDKVIVEFVATGQGSDGSSLRLPIASILTFKNGLIVRDATYYDNSR
jgi:ketosteroid isomerase-like protein